MVKRYAKIIESVMRDVSALNGDASPILSIYRKEGRDTNAAAWLGVHYRPIRIRLPLFLPDISLYFIKSFPSPGLLELKLDFLQQSNPDMR